jgi:hypothetical protein
VVADPQPFARFDGAVRWQISVGTYAVAAGEAASALEISSEASVEDRVFGSVGANR